MKKEILASSLALALFILPTGVTAAQSHHVQASPSLLFEKYATTDEFSIFATGDLLVDSGDQYVRLKGYDSYDFDFTEEDGNTLRIGYVSKNAPTSVRLYYYPDYENNPNKRVEVATYNATKQNKFTFTKTVASPEYGHYEIFVYSGNGDGGEEYNLRVRGM
ncbi:hypothetical protein D1872_155770 [compost metagenome]